VSGAGIATLQSLPNVPVGNANLVTPRGTVDFGAAGVRTSGNLNIVALQVLNSFNATVQGTTTGIPTAPAPNIGALTTASNATAPTQSGQSDRPSIIIIVEVLGYGGSSGDAPVSGEDERRRPRSDNEQDYDPNSAVHMLGNSKLTEEQKKNRTEREKNKLDRLADQSGRL
jgi:hypothetical protein